MKQMARDLQGTDDLLTIYVTRICGDKKYRSKICAFVQIPAGAAAKTLQKPDYTWNDPGDGKPRWQVSVSASTPWKGIPDHLIDDVNFRCRSALGERGWSSLQSALRGKAQRIDSGKYAAVGHILTEFVRSNQNALISLPDRQDDNVARGSHRK